MRRLARGAGIANAGTITPHSLHHTFVTLGAGADYRRVSGREGGAVSQVARNRGFSPELDPRAPRHPSPTSLWGRLGWLLLAVLSSLVLIGSVGGYVVTTYFDSTIGRLHIDFGGGTPAGGTSNWLLVGTDNRAGSGARYGNAPGQRSDTTILAHLAKDGTTTLVSIPRDTYVEVPAYTDARGITRRPRTSSPTPSTSVARRCW